MNFKKYSILNSIMYFSHEIKYNHNPPDKKLDWFDVNRYHRLMRKENYSSFRVVKSIITKENYEF